MPLTIFIFSRIQTDEICEVQGKSLDVVKHQNIQYVFSEHVLK